MYDGLAASSWTIILPQNLQYHKLISDLLIGQSYIYYNSGTISMNSLFQIYIEFYLLEAVKW
jgi:hypothetical protein